jgi:ComF family protein
VREFLAELFDLVLPPCCASCAGPVHDREALCTACWRSLHPIPTGTCVLCQLAPAAPGERCASCNSAPGPLDACLAEVWFEAETPPWVRRAKYARPGLRGVDAPARAVLSLLAERAAARVAGPAPDRVIPVPLHPRAVRRRGFNPAALLAKRMARVSGAACDPTALIRLRDTPSQTGLTRLERRQNVSGVFRARRSLSRHIWLVDDVVTTGATLAEAARAARLAGATTVIAVCGARTPAPGTRQNG